MAAATAAAAVGTVDAVGTISGDRPTIANGNGDGHQGSRQPGPHPAPDADGCHVPPRTHDKSPHSKARRASERARRNGRNVPRCGTGQASTVRCTVKASPARTSRSSRFCAHRDGGGHLSGGRRVVVEGQATAPTRRASWRSRCSPGRRRAPRCHVVRPPPSPMKRTENQDRARRSSLGPSPCGSRLISSRRSGGTWARGGERAHHGRCRRRPSAAS